jgi:hypothetical protein
MDTVRSSNKTFEMAAWGAILIWLGITTLFTSLPHGAGAIGIGLILLGMNAARRLAGVPISGFTTTIGILALVLGGLDMANSIVPLPFELPTFAILLIALGAILLGRGVLQTKRA